MKNFFGENIKWLWTMRKLNTPFSVSTYPAGSTMGAKLWGYPKPLSAIWYDNGDIYFEENEIAGIRLFLEFKYQENNKYPDRIANDIYVLINKIRKQNIIFKENENLESLVLKLKNNSGLFLKLIGYMSFRGSVQMCDVLQDKIINIINFRAAKIDKLNEAKNYLDELSLPLYHSIILEEKLDALKLSINFSKLSKVNQEKNISKYFQKYEWLSYHWLIGSSPAKEEIFKKLLGLEKNSKQSLNKIILDKKNEDKKILNLIAKLKFNAKERILLKQFREWIFMRTFVKDNINLAGFKLLPILNRISTFVEISTDDISWLTLDEILNIPSINKNVIKKNISIRKKSFSAGTINNILIFDKFEKYNNNKKPTRILSEREIKGSIAFNGVIRGIARIIIFPKDQNRLKNGEILVTSMTTPDYLPSMSRAAAFITDEGGITCHAAIVAREMKKPCIIGTKIATKVIKDGDLVEVDANNGIVKILNKIKSKR